VRACDRLVRGQRRSATANRPRAQPLPPSLASLWCPLVRNKLTRIRNASGPFQYQEYPVDWRQANRRTRDELSTCACRRARPALAPRAAPSVASDLGPADGGGAVWRPTPRCHCTVEPPSYLDGGVMSTITRQSRQADKPAYSERHVHHSREEAQWRCHASLTQLRLATERDGV
jgi:hypothetical protein